jgi:integrase
LKGKSWQARWSENGERKTKGGFATKDAALDYIAERAKDVIAAERLADLGLTPAAPPKAPTAGTFADLIPAWLETREAEERAGERRTVADDRRRWDRHLAPLLNHRTPASIDKGFISEMITSLKAPPVGTLDPKGKPKKPISATTAQRVVHLLSSFYVWAVLHKGFTANPCHGLDKPIKRKMRSTHDPKKVPFIESKADVAALFKALPEPVNVAYALSALAGLRPGEAISLEWSTVDLEANEITIVRQVRHGRVGPPKSGKPRTVPVVPSLAAVLKKWRKANPSETLVVPPLRYPGKDGKPGKSRGAFLNGRTIAEAMTAGFAKCKLRSDLNLYRAGRHTFASQWVIAGNSIYRLKEIMGHSSVQVTERYAHLTKRLTKDELSRADVKLAA